MTLKYLNPTNLTVALCCKEQFSAAPERKVFDSEPVDISEGQCDRHQHPFQPQSVLVAVLWIKRKLLRDGAVTFYFPHSVFLLFISIKDLL